jgi:hypothetical protein
MGYLEPKFFAVFLVLINRVTLYADGPQGLSGALLFKVLQSSILQQHEVAPIGRRLDRSSIMKNPKGLGSGKEVKGDVAHRFQFLRLPPHLVR